MTIATKLHILLIFTIVAVALYMYFLYKELRGFQTDLSNMKKQIQTLLSQPGQQVCAVQPAPSATTKAPAQAAQPSAQKRAPPPPPPPPPKREPITENYDDDDISVTSNEIKDILTNIQHVEEHDQQPPPPSPVIEATVAVDDNVDNDIEVNETVSIQMEDDIVMMEKKPWPDFANMTDQEIHRVKYDDLRNFLRCNGINMKGSKADLVAKIKAIVGK